MTMVEKKYTEALARMSGQERLVRMCSLFESICEMIRIQVCREYPGLEGQDLRRKIAERLYMADERTLRLLSRMG